MFFSLSLSLFFDVGKKRENRENKGEIGKKLDFICFSFIFSSQSMKDVYTFLFYFIFHQIEKKKDPLNAADLS